METKVNGFIKRFTDVLRSYSVGNDLHEIIPEWGFKPPIEDLGGRHGNCILCGTSIRYEYGILNKLNHKDIVVGSTCIKKFLKETENGQSLLDEITAAEKEFAKEKVHKLFQALYVTNDYFRQETNYRNKKVSIAESYYRQYEESGFFSPYQLRRIGKELRKKGDLSFMRFLKTNLKKPGNKDQLMKLASYDFELIWYSLSSSQRKQHKYYETVKQKMADDHSQD